MSRGYGWAQRAALEVLAGTDEWTDIPTLSKAIYDRHSEAAESSLRRALQRLVSDGAVETRESWREGGRLGVDHIILGHQRVSLETLDRLQNAGEAGERRSRVLEYRVVRERVAEEAQ